MILSDSASGSRLFQVGFKIIKQNKNGFSSCINPIFVSLFFVKMCKSEFICQLKYLISLIFCKLRQKK